MTADATVITVFWVAESVFALAAIVLLPAQLGLHRPFPVLIPSIYLPVAKLGFSRRRNVRRAFRCLINRWYRKRLWNPLLNAQRQTRGFDRRRALSSSSIHGACSGMVLTAVAFSLYFAHRAAITGQSPRTCYLVALGMSGFELVFNAPAIVLSRYLYLLTLRTPRPNPQGAANGRQPFTSDTNRTSAAAASRRSP